MMDKNAISKENLYYANYKKEKRLKDYYDEIERDKKAMDKLRDQIEQEKLYQQEKKNRIRQNQYEDHNNYLKQKYSTLPQYREKLNIKLGGEERNIKKTNYNEEMENLCINPTTEKNVYPTTPMINYSEMGRNYQKGYSHGYNIITGEVYSNPKTKTVDDNNQFNKKMEQSEYTNINSNKNNFFNKKNENESQPNFNINISRPEEYEEFLKYKQMKRQKELDNIQRDNNYSDYINRNANNNEMKQNENLSKYESAPKYDREEKGINYNNNREQSEIPSTPTDYQKEQYFNERNKDNYNEEQINSYYQQKMAQYENNYLNKNRKENFHYEKEKFNTEMTNVEKDNFYNPNNQRDNLPNSQRDAYIEKYYPEYYQRESESIPQSRNIKEEQLLYPQQIENPNIESFEYQRQIDKREQENIPNDYKIGDNFNNKLTEYEMMLKRNNNNNDEVQFRNNISLGDNQQMPMPEEKNSNYLNENEKYREFLKSNNNSVNNNVNNNNYDNTNDNIKDIEKDKYMQFLLNKTKENKENIDNKEKQLNYSEYINKEQNYPNKNNNYMNYKEQMRNYPDVREQIQNDNNYYYKSNPENNYYNEKENIPIQYNNYISQNDYQNQLLREREREREALEQNAQEMPEQNYLSYQEQIERIKRQKQEMEKGENKNLPLNDNNNNNINNQNIKEIISEYNKNRAKNISNEDHIFKTNDVPPVSTPPKYNDEPLSSKERKQIQRDYAKYLEWQINEKNARTGKTPFYQKYNPILDNNNKKVYEEGENPYQQIREKNNAMKDIPINPYTNKNYDINNKSNLGYNPISHLNYNYPQNK